MLSWVLLNSLVHKWICLAAQKLEVIIDSELIASPTIVNVDAKVTGENLKQTNKQKKNSAVHLRNKTLQVIQVNSSWTTN